MDMQNIENQFTEFKSQLDVLNKKTPEDKCSMVVFSGDLDKAIAAFVIATGAVAMGMDAVMFFTFWGTSMLRDKTKSVVQDEHGRYGYGHDEIAYEKEECGVRGANAGNVGRIGRTDLRLRDDHGSDGN
jgi:hypothetical protein